MPLPSAPDLRPTSINVVTEQPAEVRQQEALGWGEEAQETLVSGRAKCVEFWVEGKVALTISVSEDGRLRFTDHGQQRYLMQVGQNFELEPRRSVILGL